MGRVLDDDDGTLKSQPGDTLVTSIDARVQSVVEKQLAEMIRIARSTRDPVTGRNYVADSGAAVVMEADTGRIVAMASQPTYDPSVWVGGISQKQLSRLYSTKAGTPLLGRATQGQFAPGLDLEAVHDRRCAHQRLRVRHPAELLLGVPGRQPGVQELRVRRLRLHRLRQGARGLVQHVLLPGGYGFWQRFGTDVADVHARDPLVAGGPDVRLRQRDRDRHAGRGLRPDRRPQVEACLLRVPEGLLLRDRRQAPGQQDQRLRLPVRPGVLRGGLRLPRR